MFSGNYEKINLMIPLTRLEGLLFYIKSTFPGLGVNLTHEMNGSHWLLACKVGGVIILEDIKSIFWP